MVEVSLVLFNVRDVWCQVDDDGWKDGSGSGGSH